MKKINVSFVCVHNSCRSQIAEAIGNIVIGDIANIYSAGTEYNDKINQDAVRIMKNMYGIDMEYKQKPKLVSQLPKLDVLITMGCNVNCPIIPAKMKEDWGLDDPTGKEDSEFLKIIQTIIIKMLELRNKIEEMV